MSAEQDIQRELVLQIAEFYDDPLGHVLFSYPWGQGRTGPQKAALPGNPVTYVPAASVAGIAQCGV